MQRRLLSTARPVRIARRAPIGLAGPKLLTQLGALCGRVLREINDGMAMAGELRHGLGYTLGD